MTEFCVTERRDVVPKRTDRYRSFPGWVRTRSGEILLGYRDAESAPGTRSHGLGGDFLLMRSADGRWPRISLSAAS